MKAFEISIWRGVKHNDVFSHNDVRVGLVHARNEVEAREKVTLCEGRVTHLSGLDIDVSPEVIYSVRDIGVVRIKRFYVYSDGRSPVLIGK